MTRAERETVARAIRDAEDGTTGRIAVRVIPDRDVDAFERAKREFGEIGFHRHEAANAALILVAPKAQRFAIVGDRELHARVGDAFWRQLVDESQPYFARGATTDGILHAVNRIGSALQTHFAEPSGSAE